MGHYDSCYEEDWEQGRPERERRKAEEIAKIQKFIDKYGLAKALYMIKNGYSF